SFALPNGEFGNYAGSGFGVGGFWEKSFTGNFSGNASVQYLTFGEKDEGDGTHKILGLNYDLHYYPGDGFSGFYGLAGLGYHSYANTWSSADGDVSESLTGLAINVGAGYYFTENLGAEVRLSTAKFGNSDYDLEERTNWIQVSFRYRF
ncbi:MAG: porin family protein, partial [Holophagales bacterium]|nr:porin family protein [Holophagales bacterium]